MRILTIVLLNLVMAILFHKRALRYLQIFQQEQYDNVRFQNWLLARRAFDRSATIVVLLTALLVAFTRSWGLFRGSLILILGGAIIAWRAWSEEDPRVAGKVRLKMTERATRILNVASIAFALALVCADALALGLSGASGFLFWVFQLALIQSVPFTIVLANRCLQPAENRRQAEYIREAKEILAKQRPFVIGITGSYGKTSTKAVLSEVMNACLGPTFFPAKGINSPMGITREIREKLKSAYRFAVVEMAAFQPGSIRRLCDLVPPQAGLVTAVGVMHLERMGSEENIYRAKSELPQAVPQDGILVLNGDNAGTRRMASEFRKKTTLLYGFDNTAGDLDCSATDLVTVPEGTRFKIHWRGSEYQAAIPLFGRPAVSNVLGAFAMVCTLGADPAFVVAALANLDAVDNRLQVGRSEGVVRLKDAHNSNPEGFAAALEVLASFSGKRRILVTPGMIELGARQFEENKKVAMQAARVCDLVYVVGLTNREALVAGLREGGMAPEKFETFDDMRSALVKFEGLAEEGDVLLIENDLPDVYEAAVNF